MYIELYMCIERASDNVKSFIIAKLKAAANYLHYFFIFTGVSTNHPRYPIDDVRHRDLSPTLPSNSKTGVSVCLHLLKSLCDSSLFDFLPIVP